MKLRDFAKILLSLGLALILGGLLPVLELEEAKTFGAVSRAERARRAKLARVKGYRLCTINNLEEANALLGFYEQELPRARRLRHPILAQLACLCFLMGERAGIKERKNFYEKGKGYGESLKQEKPRRAEGYYWMALNLCGLAELDRASVALKLLPDIVKDMQTAASINKTYNQGGAHRVLGRIYYMAPNWPMSIGDLNESRRHLEAAVKVAPKNSTNHLYLAETLIAMGKVDEAHRELHQVLKSTSHAEWAPGLEDDRKEALRLMSENKLR